MYFTVSLIGDQALISRTSSQETVHIWLPVFLSLKFLFFFGWLRVAETLYNPFGDDDEDFGMDELLDRHAKVIKINILLFVNFENILTILLNSFIHCSAILFSVHYCLMVLRKLLYICVINKASILFPAYLKQLLTKQCLFLMNLRIRDSDKYSRSD